jgi:GTP cyclohydrolase II
MDNKTNWIIQTLKKAKLGELELLATNTKTHNSLQHLGICLIENWFCIWDIYQTEIDPI